jgi:hypothetical protein
MAQAYEEFVPGDWRFGILLAIVRLALKKIRTSPRLQASNTDMT